MTWKSDRQAVQTVGGRYNAYMIKYNLLFHLLETEKETEKWEMWDCWKIQESLRFIYSSPSVCVCIHPPFYYAGEDVLSLLMIFLSSPLFTVNKSCPVLTRRSRHRWHPPFHQVILERKSNSLSPLPSLSPRVMSRCLVGRGVTGETMTQDSLWFLKEGHGRIFHTSRAPFIGETQQPCQDITILST